MSDLPKRPEPTERQREEAEKLIGLSRHEGFKLFMAKHNQAGEEILSSLLDATVNPDIPVEDRKELVFQYACHLYANRMVGREIEETIINGKTDEELKAYGFIR